MSSRHCVGTRVTKYYKYYMSLILDTFFIFQIKILKQNTKKQPQPPRKTQTQKKRSPNLIGEFIFFRFVQNVIFGPQHLCSRQKADRWTLQNQTPFQTNHPEFGAGEAPPNFPVKETFEAFCTFRSPNFKPSRKLPTSPVVECSKTHAIATTNQHGTIWRWHGTWDKIQAKEVGTGFGGSYHGY